MTIMKKIATTLLILTTFLLQGMAQVKFLDIYQRDRIAQTFATTDVDSISVTGSGNTREVNFFRGTDLVNSYRVSVIDSIKFFRSNEEPPVYMGIVGFNQDLYTKPVDVLSTSTASQFKSFINDLTTKDGRMLYYAVDSALDMLESYNFPTPLGSVNVITFFDGLDQGSLMMNPSYSTETQYLNAINERISSMKVRNLPLTAYSIGMRVNDAVDNGLFQNNLKSLATGSDKAEEVSSMSAVHTRLQEIADRIVCASTKQNITVRIPGTSNGTQVCFTFDGETPANSSMYIMGTFNLSDCSLHDVTCHGIIGENATVQGTRDGIFVTYTFTGLQREDGNGSVPVSNIRQYYKAGTSSKWQVNPEFSSDNTQTATTHTGSVILLVLDCSKALGTQFGNLQSYVDDFIQLVADNMASFSLSAPDNVKAELALRDDEFCINVCWNAVRNAEHYEIYRSDSSTGTFTKVAENVTGTFWIDESPLSGNNYYKVLAVGHGLTSDESRVTEAVNYTLDAPENVVASLDDELFTVNITWDAVDFAESYNVYRSSSSDGEFSLVSMAVAGTSWSDPAPISGANYYKVQATGHGLTSQQSTVSNKINYALSSPSNVQAALDDEDFVINVTWDAVQYAESYIIYRSDSNTGTFTKVAEDVTGTLWIDESPLPGGNFYKVKAVGHGMESVESSETTVANYVLDAPQNVTLIYNEDQNVVHIQWDEVKYATTYNVYRSDDEEGNYALVASDITTTTWTDSSPEPWNYYQVRAVNNDIVSSASETVEGGQGNGTKEIIVNGVTFKMIKVSGGTFLMGKSADGNDKTPVHSVTLSDYYIGETEVTQELWQAVMGSNPSHFKGSNLPVECVSWDDCQTFITKSNQLTGKKFRLPTEAEWEFAAKGGTQSKGYTYSGSNTIGDVAWYYGNSGEKTHGVATKAPNELGIYDMSGNVWERCQDMYGDYSSAAQTNPTGPTSGRERVCRGGDFSYGNCRVTYRHPIDFWAYTNIGLRLAL